VAKQKANTVAKNVSADKLAEAKAILDGLTNQLLPLTESLSNEPTNAQLQKDVKAMEEKVAAAQADYDAALEKSNADGTESLATVNTDGTFEHKDVPGVMIEITVPALNFGGSVGVVSKEAILADEKLLDELVQMNIADGELNQNGPLRITV
jgi:hypothetical protein